MDLAFTPQQEALRQEVRAWLRINVPPSAAIASNHPTAPADEDAEAQKQAAWERKLHRAGYSGLAWPTEYGGRGLSIIEHFIVAEE